VVLTRDLAACRPQLRFEWRSAPQALPGALRTLPRVLVVNGTLALSETWSFVPREADDAPDMHMR
jgi:hypothetical protein